MSLDAGGSRLLRAQQQAQAAEEGGGGGGAPWLPSLSQPSPAHVLRSRSSGPATFTAAAALAVTAVDGTPPAARRAQDARALLGHGLMHRSLSLLNGDTGPDATAAHKRALMSGAAGSRSSTLLAHVPSGGMEGAAGSAQEAAPSGAGGSGASGGPAAGGGAAEQKQLFETQKMVVELARRQNRMGDALAKLERANKNRLDIQERLIIKVAQQVGP